MLCDCCLNKSICRVRQMKDEVYPDIEIDISSCQRHEAGVSREMVTPVVPIEKKRRSLKELASVSARIQKITKEKAEKSNGVLTCSVCKKEIEDGVTDARTGKIICQSCYEEL